VYCLDDDLKQELQGLNKGQLQQLLDLENAGLPPKSPDLEDHFDDGSDLPSCLMCFDLGAKCPSCLNHDAHQLSNNNPTVTSESHETSSPQEVEDTQGHDSSAPHVEKNDVEGGASSKKKKKKKKKVSQSPLVNNGAAASPEVEPQGARDESDDVPVESSSSPAALYGGWDPHGREAAAVAEAAAAVAAAEAAGAGALDFGSATAAATTAGTWPQETENAKGKDLAHTKFSSPECLSGGWDPHGREAAAVAEAAAAVAAAEAAGAGALIFRSAAAAAAATTTGTWPQETVSFEGEDLAAFNLDDSAGEAAEVVGFGARGGGGEEHTQESERRPSWGTCEAVPPMVADVLFRYGVKEDEHLALLRDLSAVAGCPLSSAPGVHVACGSTKGLSKKQET
jgi:hypothetical protein